MLLRQSSNQTNLNEIWSYEKRDDSHKKIDFCLEWETKIEQILYGCTSHAVKMGLKLDKYGGGESLKYNHSREGNIPSVKTAHCT